MGDKAISMGALAKLKQKAAGARRRVSTKREALGQTNERGGPDSPRESLGAVPHIEPVKKKGFLAKMKGLLTRGKSKSGRSSKGERKKSLAEESVTKLNLSAESTSAPSTPRYGATSSALSAAPAPSSDSIVGTPRYKGSCDAAAPTEAPATACGTPRYMGTDDAAPSGQPLGTPRYGATAGAGGTALDDIGVSLDATLALTPELTAKVAESFETSRAALDQKAKLAAAAWILGKRFGPEQARAPLRP